jgi:hypothetical protein
MVEKPLALTVEDCLRVGEAVERTGGMLMTAFKMRYYDMVLKARHLIPEPILVTMQISWPVPSRSRSMPLAATTTRGQAWLITSAPSFVSTTALPAAGCKGTLPALPYS